MIQRTSRFPEFYEERGTWFPQLTSSILPVDHQDPATVLVYTAKDAEHGIYAHDHGSNSALPVIDPSTSYTEASALISLRNVVMKTEYGLFDSDTWLT